MDSISSSATRNTLQPQAYGAEDTRTSKKSEKSSTDGASTQKTATDSPSSGSKTLSAAEQAAISELKKRDQTVRQHEMAHLAASGGLAVSGAKFSMQTGPDGKRYAIGGEVSIDLSPGRTPEETIRKARIIQAAALAPAEPSGQDRSVAAQARAMEAQAAAEIAQRSRQQQTVANRYQSNTLPNSTIAAQA